MFINDNKHEKEADRIFYCALAAVSLICATLAIVVFDFI
jgi:hypothetical protein